MVKILNLFPVVPKAHFGIKFTSCVAEVVNLHFWQELYVKDETLITKSYLANESQDGQSFMEHLSLSRIQLDCNLKLYFCSYLLCFEIYGFSNSDLIVEQCNQFRLYYIDI